MVPSVKCEDFGRDSAGTANPSRRSGWTTVKLCLEVGFLVVAINGLMSPARAVHTFNPAAVQDSPNGPWQCTTARPADDWYTVDFDDRQWTKGQGGFGEPSTPGSRVNTDWLTPDIWLRRTVNLTAIPEKPALLIHHDEEAEIFINGQKVAAVEKWITEYKILPLSDDAQKALKSGENLLAVHCHQNGGGQFIDVHLIDADNIPKLPAATGKPEPYKTELITEWGSKVTPENAWQEYPRPQLVRSNWTNLNGNWDYAISSGEQQTPPAEWSGKILVPFAIESRLSGVQKHLQPGESLWYRRSFKSKKSAGKKLLLNFEAVDYRCKVTVNGQDVGSHVGGNLPFSIDITDAIKDGTNELVVRVEDATDGAQLRGKQHLRPHAIWYTRVSGIWQTVWLEEVPDTYIVDLDFRFELDSMNAESALAWVQLHSRLGGLSGEGLRMRYSVKNGPTVTVKASDAGRIEFENPDPWSPDSPHLYQLNAELLNSNSQVLDSVESYFALRHIEKSNARDGIWRLQLNSEPIFHFGPLDQGWWPDGLLTPPSDQALAYDIEFLKAAGFNMIRKHIKIEPRRFYYHCDRLGMMVWQDQPSALINPPWTRMAPNPEDAVWSDADHQQYMAELDGMITHLEDVPSIVMWVPFNEAWGQHRTMEVGKWTVDRDKSRLVNVASGGNFWPVGDIADEHSYPHPAFPFDQPRFNDYVKVVGEFGGHGWPVQDHLFANSDRNWGYGDLPKTVDEYKARYRESIRILTELKARGISAGVYTQTTDVEGEINGLMTYDRKVIKIPAEELRLIHEPLLKN